MPKHGGYKGPARRRQEGAIERTIERLAEQAGPHHGARIFRGPHSAQWNRPNSYPGQYRSLVTQVGTAATPIEIISTGSFTLLNGIAAGTSLGERNGRHATLRSLQCRGIVRLKSTETTQVVRMVIFYDRQANGAAPTATDLLDQDQVFSFPRVCF